jgi:hypothetical protein
MELKTFGTENFQIEKTEKYSSKSYNMESQYFITNIINDGTTFVTSDTIDELIELLQYIKNG